MFCILGAFAATRTNDPGCTPRVVIYGLCGSIAKGLARGPSIRRGQVPARRHTRGNRRHRGLLPGHRETARLQRLLRAVGRNLGCGRHRMAGPGRADQGRSADPVRGRRPPPGDRADARAPGPRRVGFRTGPHVGRHRVRAPRRTAIAALWPHHRRLGRCRAALDVPSRAGPAEPYRPGRRRPRPAGLAGHPHARPHPWPPGAVPGGRPCPHRGRRRPDRQPQFAWRRPVATAHPRRAAALCHLELAGSNRVCG